MGLAWPVLAMAKLAISIDNDQEKGQLLQLINDTSLPFY